MSITNIIGQSDWRQKPRCSVKLANGEFCDRLIFPGAESCRWHLMMEGYQAKAKHWHRPLAVLLITFGTFQTLDGGIALFHFLTTISFPRLAGGVFTLLIADYALSLGAIYWGVRNPLAAIALAIGIMGLGAGLTVFLIASAIAMGLGVHLPEDYTANMLYMFYEANMPYVLFLSLVAVWAIFFMSQFMNSVLMRKYSDRLVFSLVSLVLLALIADAFFSGNKLISLVLILVQVGYFLDFNFNWTRHLRKW